MFPVQTVSTVKGVTPGVASRSPEGFGDPVEPGGDMLSPALSFFTGRADRLLSDLSLSRQTGPWPRNRVGPVRSPYSGQMPRGRLVAYAGLIALVLINVVLMALLLRPSVPASSTAAESDPAAAEATADDVVEEAPAEPAEVEAPPEPALVQPEPTQRLIAAASETVAWRAVVGFCDAPGTLEHTTDGGVTWSPQPVELGPIGRLKATSATAVFAIGGGVDCEPSFRFSNTSGSTFVTADNELPGSWYLLPGTRDALQAEVHGPRGQVIAPCPTGVVDLAGLDTDRGALLCTDGAVHTTGDGGIGWTQVGAAPGGVAIAPTADGYLVGALREQCDGVTVLAVGNDGAGLEDEDPTCAPVPVGSPGQVALASAGSALWVWSGDGLARSLDGGATW